jgi:O-antigen ligase
VPSFLATWRFVSLTLWAIGVQTHEALCTVGMAAVVVSFVPEVSKLNRSVVLAWWPLLAFIGWSLVAPTLGGNPPDGTGVARTFDWFSIPFAAAAFSALTDAQRTRVVQFTAATFALSCFVAGLQHFGWWPPESAFASWSWLRIPFARVYEPISEGATRFMGGGLLFHRLKFSHVSGLVLVGLVVVASRARRAGLFALITFGLIAVWLFPYARMGAVAATVGVGVTVLLSSQHRRRAVVVLGVLGLAGGVLLVSFEPLRARFAAGLTDQGSGQRTQHLAAGLEAIRQHPFLGVGPGQFRPSRFGGPDMAEHVKDNPGKAHNQFVSIAAETGIPGALGFVALLGWLVVRARRTNGDWVLTAGATAQFVVLSLVHDPLFQVPYSLALVLLLGLGLAAPKPATSSTDVG